MLNVIDLSRVDLNLLVLFEAAMEERHVGRAAERLKLTPSAVSHGLGRLRRLLNDPLFLKTPRGVVPTERATTLAPAIAELLARARSILESAEPFDPRRSHRRFLLGSPDALAAVYLPPLLAELRQRAPGIDVAVRQHLRDTALVDLDNRALDIAIIPVDEVAARFHAEILFEEDFVIAMRAGHPYATEPSIEN
jgi:DNA-binding transcriptional LysR family regulator